jgi:predicted small metal-binding protein
MMEKKVIVKNYGIIHYSAMCLKCNWEASNYKNRAKLRRMIRTHVRNTGHEVSLEVGVAKRYLLGKK